MFISIVFLIELLRKPVLNTEPDAVRKLKMFYQTCISAGKKNIFSKNFFYYLFLKNEILQSMKMQHILYSYNI